MKLNLGCGSQLLKGFVNVDQIQFKGLDVEAVGYKVDNIVHLIEFKDNSVEMIYAAHCLQCMVPRSIVPIALAHWFRVLKPGGKIIIEVPTIVPAVQKYLAGKISMETLVQGIYGHDQNGLRQTLCFDFEYLYVLLKKARFKNIEQIKQPSYSRHDPQTNLVLKGTK